jgi:tetratricopeptide (TPR) repeat protein
LIDAVGQPSTTGGKVRVPDWLLPQLHDPPLPIRGSASGDDANSALLHYSAYGDALASEGDCWRAETEYRRVAFLAKTVAVDVWSRIKVGNCQYRGGNWESAASQFLRAAEESRTEPETEAAYLMAGASYFNAGDYETCGGILDRIDYGDDVRSSGIDGPENDNLTFAQQDRHDTQKEKAALLRGLCTLAMGNWGGSAERFQQLAEDYPDSLTRNRALFLRWKSEEGATLPRKRPKLAAGLSAILPGAGQTYAGRAFDGFRHLVFDGLLIYSVYRLIESDNYAGGYLLAGFTLPFYVGNIMGAKRSAESHNASERASYVSLVISEAGKE